jgi:hypothetical protein
MWKTFVKVFLSKKDDLANEEDIFDFETDNIKTSTRKSIIISFMNKTRQIFMGYIKALIQKHPCDYEINLNTGHIFYLNSETSRTMQSCKCGLFSMKATERTHFTFFTLDSDDLGRIVDNLELFLSFSQESNNRIIRNELNVRLIDCFESKLNCFKVISDVLTTILNVGVFVYN